MRYQSYLMIPTKLRNPAEVFGHQRDKMGLHASGLVFLNSSFVCQNKDWSVWLKKIQLFYSLYSGLGQIYKIPSWGAFKSSVSVAMGF